MKGDMAGAACVVGLMHALASRKAKVNAIGVIGLVENMPDGGAIRPGRHPHLDVGPDDRGHQHRRRGPARARRRAVVHAGEVQAGLHDRSGDPDRRDHRRARPGICRPVLQRRRTGGPAHPGRHGDRREGLAHAARARLRQADRFEIRRHQECGRPQRRLDHGGAVPASDSSAARPGRISTSPAPAWPRRRARSTRPGARAGACACSTGWSPTTTRK